MGLFSYDPGGEFHVRVTDEDFAAVRLRLSSEPEFLATYKIPKDLRKFEAPDFPVREILALFDGASYLAELASGFSHEQTFDGIEATRADDVAFSKYVDRFNAKLSRKDAFARQQAAGVKDSTDLAFAVAGLAGRALVKGALRVATGKSEGVRWLERYYLNYICGDSPEAKRYLMHFADRFGPHDDALIEVVRFIRGQMWLAEFARKNRSLVPRVRVVAPRAVAEELVPAVAPFGSGLASTPVQPSAVAVPLAKAVKSEAVAPPPSTPPPSTPPPSTPPPSPPSPPLAPSTAKQIDWDLPLPASVAVPTVAVAVPVVPTPAETRPVASRTLDVSARAAQVGAMLRSMPIRALALGAGGVLIIVLLLLVNRSSPSAPSQLVVPPPPAPASAAEDPPVVTDSPPAPLVTTPSAVVANVPRTPMRENNSVSGALPAIEPAVNPAVGVNASSPSTQNLLVQGERDYRAGRFAAALDVARAVLANQPNHSRGLLLAGESLYALKRFPESVLHFEFAIDRGETVELRVQHHHASKLGKVGFGGANSLAAGILRVSRKSISFHEGGHPDDDFAVNIDGIRDVKNEPQKAARVNVNVAFMKDGREDRRDFNFQNLAAKVERDGSLACRNCDASMGVVFALLQRIRGKSKD